MSWWQGLLTVALGNLIVLVPILLNSHPGTKYGIPFPVLVRSSFGIRGANVAAMARALVACGWFGIQTWIGALALDTLMTTLTSGWADVTGHKAIAFGFFWALQVAIILRGIDGIKFLESYAAPILIGGSVGLLIWAFAAAGNVFSASAQLIGGNEDFWTLFGPGLAANVGYWITLSMNIPDFTRYAKDQRSQLVGQSIAMPITMTGFSFIGIAVTCATVIEFDEAIWDPVTLVARLLADLPILLIVAMIVIVIAQISTNMAANVVSPSNDFSNLSPRQISFRTGGLITAVIGIISFPWKLYEDVGAYIFTWLVGYGSLLASFLAVMVFDYWLLRRARLDVVELYRYGPGGKYWFSGGYNWRALVAVAAGVIPVLPGLHQRGDDGGRRGGRSELPRPALPLRRVRGVRPLRRDVPRAHARPGGARPGPDRDRLRWTSASPSKPTRRSGASSSSRKRAEDLGFDYAWTFDSHILWQEPYVIYAQMLAATERIVVGPFVTNPATRDPTVTASLFATLNEGFGNRTICGIGRGDSARRVLGKKPTTLAETEEAMHVIKELAEGRAIQTPAGEVRIPWVVDGKLDVWMAGYGPKALALCGRKADGFILQLADPVILQWTVAHVRAAAEEAGRDPDELKICVAAPAYLGDDLAHAREQCRWFGGMVGNHVADLVKRYGEGGDIPVALTDYIRAREGYDYSHHGRAGNPDTEFVPDEIVDRFCVLGTVEDHVAKLRELESLGVDQFNIYLMHDAQEATLDGYGERVIPALRGSDARTARGT